jgi:GDPmannose 4,6-dehydratase
MTSDTKNPEALRALITGAGGQTGFWLGRELETSGRQVIRCSRRGGDFSLPLDDPAALRERLSDCRPQEIYHLACPSCLKDTAAFERDVFKMSVDVVLVFLRWIVEESPQTRMFLAGSSEIFGSPTVTPQDESTPPSPAHPYAAAKLAGQHLLRYFREKKGVFAVTGILYNHESSLRRADFVSKRIAAGVASIVHRRSNRLEMGNLQAVRDWSHAADFARGFRLALEADVPGDYVFASGQGRTVEEFCKRAFESVDLDFRKYGVANPSMYLPDSPLPRVGKCDKARRELGWEPRRAFEDWVGEMVQIEINRQSVSLE